MKSYDKFRRKEDNCITLEERVDGHDSLVIRARWSMVDRILNL